MHHAIIGSGPAGVIAAETLRKLDPGATISLINGESEPPYSRMAIPYLLSTNIDEQGTYLRKRDGYYDALQIDIVEKRVSQVDSAAKQLHLNGDQAIRYDKLLVATGSRPLAPPIPGRDLSGVHPCWTLDDSRRISERAQAGSDVVLLGAGFIGCIILQSLKARGVKLSVVEMENRMVPRMLNEVAGGLLKKWCENQGVAVFTSSRVEAIEVADASKLRVVLEGGTTLDADLVVTATGVQPNCDFLSSTDIKIEDGVVVDRQLRSSNADIFAAGDVAYGVDFSTGDYSVHAIQPAAAEHGRIAALNMSGREASHQGSLNMNVLDTLGLVSTSFGLWQGVDGGQTAELRDPERFRYLALQFEEDILVGANTLGVTDHIGVLRGLIQSRTRLGKWKQVLIDDASQIMQAYLATTQALGAN